MGSPRTGLYAVVSQQVHAYVSPGRCACCGRDRFLTLAAALERILRELALDRQVLLFVHRRDPGRPGRLLILHPGAAVYCFRNAGDLRTVLAEHFIHGRRPAPFYLGSAQ